MTYDTHLPVLEFLCDNFNITKVLELGVGEASTFFLAKKIPELISVESDVGWCERIKKGTPDHHRVHLGSALDFAARTQDKYSLSFVDSNPADERKECVQHLLLKSDIVVAHDTEPESEWNYRYSSIKLPYGFVRLDYTKASPWTSIYTSHLNVQLKIEKWLNS